MSRFTEMQNQHTGPLLEAGETIKPWQAPTLRILSTIETESGEGLKSWDGVEYS